MAIDGKYGRVTLENGTIGEDEPVVVFRAQDRVLPKLLKVYKIMCELAGSPQRHLDAIHDAAVKVKAWQADNPTKTPSSDTYKPAPVEEWRNTASEQSLYVDPKTGEPALGLINRNDVFEGRVMTRVEYEKRRHQLAD